MTSNLNEIGKKALELSPHERALLIRQLLESLKEGEQEENAEDLWDNEVKKRCNQYKQGKTSEKPANQVLKKAKKNLN